MRLQVTVAEPDQTGRRPFEIYSHPDNHQNQTNTNTQWTRHATEHSARSRLRSNAQLEGSWPPEGAVPVDVDGLYGALAEQGLEYGAAFKGLRAAWRHGEDLLAEVALPEGEQTQGFAVHPALLDAGLHVLAADWARDAEDAPRVPFSWSGVSVHAVGARSVRVRLTSGATDAVSLAVYDGAGVPVSEHGLARPAQAVPRASPHGNRAQLRLALQPGVDRGSGCA